MDIDKYNFKKKEIKMKKIYIWGTGIRAKEQMEKNIYKDCEIIAFIDNYKTKATFYNYPIVYADEISEDYDFIVISVEEPNAILEQCNDLKIDKNKIIVIFKDNILIDRYKNTYVYGKSDAELSLIYKYINMQIKNDNEKIYTCYYDEIDQNRLVGNSSFSGEYYHEYIRYRTFELVAEELKKLDDQNWNVAELGVFKGAFSRMINMKFKNKYLYMFDTFEGFDSQEGVREMQEGNCDEKFIDYFSNNNVDMVIKSMPYRDKCIVKKGLFPETAQGLEEQRYGFVSLDVDFGDSTLLGMEYFYPRLIENGYIFVHDYNHISLQGVKKAINKYEEKYNIKLKKVPLCDSNGTLIIIK